MDNRPPPSTLIVFNYKVVQEALEVAQQGRTSITIAHRLSTIMESDRSAFMNGDGNDGDGDGDGDYCFHMN